MSRRKKRRESNTATTPREIQRELERGRIQEALRSAQISFQQAPSPDRQQLLEVAYLARIQQLHRQRLEAEARACLRELLAIDGLSPDTSAKLPRLRVILGDSQVDLAAVFSEQPELLNELTDQAVLETRAIAPEVQDIPLHCQAVRAAFSDVEQGADDAAEQRLRDIPRSSPLADWRIFVRGLSAFYRGERERCHQNWQRLDVGRPAYRIAATLLTAAGEAEALPHPVDATARVRRLQLRMQSDAAAVPLRTLLALWQEEEWYRFLRELRSFRQRFAASHRGLLDKIVELVWQRAVRGSDPVLLEKLMQAAPAPPLDPHWNRAWALLLSNGSESDMADIEKRWKAYAREVEHLEILRPDERPIAAALVWQRLALNYERFLQGGEGWPHFMRLPPEIEDEYRRGAAHAYRQCIQRYPVLRSAYAGLTALHEQADELEHAATVWEKYVHHMPEDYEARLWLANYYLSADEPDRAAPHVEMLLRVRPRDPQSLVVRSNQRLARVRALAKSKQYEAAHTELELLFAEGIASFSPYVLPTLRAGIEFRAKRADTARRHLAEALATVGDPTPVWAQMTSVAARFGLSRELKKEFDQQFKAAMQGKPSTEVAGAVALHFQRLRANDVSYPGRVTQERLFVKYLASAVDMAWNESDLVEVCQFIAVQDRQWGLRSRLVHRGRSLFPQSPIFLVYGVWDMVGTSTYRYCHNLAPAIQDLERALELNARATIPLSAGMLEAAQNTLHELRDEEAARQHYREQMSGEAAQDEDVEEANGHHAGARDELDYCDDDDAEHEWEWDDNSEMRSPPETSAMVQGIIGELERLAPPGELEELQRVLGASGYDLPEAIQMMIEEGSINSMLGGTGTRATTSTETGPRMSDGPTSDAGLAPTEDAERPVSWRERKKRYRQRFRR